MQTFYMDDFILLYMANLLNIISPGANVAITVRNSTTISRKVGIMTSMGIICSSSIHKGCTLCGFGLMVSQTFWLFQLIQYVGCSYLFYLGIQCFWRATSLEVRKKILKFLPLIWHAHSGNGPNVLEGYRNDATMTKSQAFRIGFVTNMLNPQAILCFITIVAATVRPATPLLTRGIYFMTLVCTSVVWYSVVALFFSHPLLIKKLYSVRPWIERLTGISLVFFAYKMLLIT